MIFRYITKIFVIHWISIGKRFFDLHFKFEELNTDANIKVDEIGERILILGETLLHTFDAYIITAKVRVDKNSLQNEKAVELIVDSLTEMLKI